MTRRIVFVHLPFFPIERHIRQSLKQARAAKPWWDEQARQSAPSDKANTAASGPLVLVQHGAKGTRISALGPDGYAQGLWVDMKLADARTMVPTLDVVTHDEVADRVALSALGQWLLRYSPCVAAYGDHDFVLDIRGCAHLFGDEKAMAENMAARLKAFGLTARIAIADTLACGFALSHYAARDLHMMAPHSDVAALDPLRIEALRLDDDTVTLLKRLGLKRIGDVRCLPRAALERRFRDSTSAHAFKRHSAKAAQSVQWRLDQLSGLIDEPIRYIKEPPLFRTSLQCPALALQPEAVGLALEKLLPRLCAQLAQAGKGARRFCLSGYRADGGVSHVAVSLSQPAHHPDIVQRLFKDRLDQIDCGFGIDLFVIHADDVQAVSASQNVLLAGQAGTSMATPCLSAPGLANFADVVSNRAGPRAVFRLRPCASHVPERAQRFVAVNTAIDWRAWDELQPAWSPRPLRLLARPEPVRATAELPDSPPVQFIWRRVLRRIVRSRGPERILPEWWHDNLKAKRSATFRDYYDVEDNEGLRYWIFRAIKDEPVEGSNQTQRRIDWYVHGLF